MSKLSLFVEAYLKQRRKKHGAGKAPFKQAVGVALHYVAVGTGDARWMPMAGPLRWWFWTSRNPNPWPTMARRYMARRG